MRTLSVGLLSLLAINAFADVQVLSPLAGKYLSREIGAPAAPLATTLNTFGAMGQFTSLASCAFKSGPSGVTVNGSTLTVPSTWSSCASSNNEAAEKIYWGPYSTDPVEIPENATLTYEYFMCVVPLTLTYNNLTDSRGTFTFSGAPVKAQLSQWPGTSDRKWIAFQDPTDTNRGLLVNAFRLTSQNANGFAIRTSEAVTDFTVHYVTEATYSWSNTTAVKYHVRSKNFRIAQGATFVQSIDTRIEASQPDHEGQVLPDANTESGYVSFPDWYYSGGLFVGNSELPTQGTTAPKKKADKSGVARILAKPTASTPPSGYDLSTMGLALFDLGHPNRKGYLHEPPYVVNDSYNLRCNSADPVTTWPTDGPITWKNRLNLHSGDDLAIEFDNLGAVVGPVVDVAGSSSKFYFFGSINYAPAASPYIEIRLSDEGLKAKWRCFSSAAFISKLNDYNHPDKTYYQRTAPFSAPCYMSQATYTTN